MEQPSLSIAHGILHFTVHFIDLCCSRSMQRELHGELVKRSAIVDQKQGYESLLASTWTCPE